MSDYYAFLISLDHAKNPFPINLNSKWIFQIDENGKLSVDSRNRTSEKPIYIILLFLIIILKKSAII